LNKKTFVRPHRRSNPKSEGTHKVSGHTRNVHIKEGVNGSKTYFNTIEIEDSSDFDHELGHLVLSKILEGELEDPGHRIDTGLLEDKYHEGVGEAYANTFSDYLNYPEELKKDFPDAYQFWDEVFEINPQLSEEVEEVQAEAKEKGLYERPEYVLRFMQKGEIYHG